jgi:hypothetical protein
MAVTHPTAIRNLLADLVVDQIDLNTPPGKLVLQIAAGTVVSTLTFANPAFGTAASGTATANAIVADSSAVGNATAVSKGEIRQGGATPIVLFSVTATGGGGDITFNSVNISAGQNVSITALTYAAPP